MNACESLESLDSREQGCSEETEDKVYSLLRILPRPARHSGRLRQRDHKFETSLDTLVRLCPLENKACVLGAGADASLAECLTCIHETLGWIKSGLKSGEKDVLGSFRQGAEETFG